MHQLFVRLLVLMLAVLLIFGVYRLVTIRPLAELPYFVGQPTLVAVEEGAATQPQANARVAEVALSTEGVLTTGDGVSLQQILAAQPSQRALIFLKAPNLQGVAALLQAVDAADARTRVLAVVDDPLLSRVLRQQAPDLATAATSAEAEAFMAMQRVRLTAFYRPVAPALLVPAAQLSPALIRAAHNRGVQVLAWVSSSEASQLQTILALGADGVIVVPAP